MKLANEEKSECHLPEDTEMFLGLYACKCL